jgi:transketolase
MGLEDVAAMRGLPGMTILQPGDALETRQAVEWMLQHQGPVYLRLTRQKLDDVHLPDYKFECGKSDVVWEPAPKAKHFQATVFASGGTVGGAVAAARELLPKGFAVRVVNVGTIAPFDVDAAELFAKDSERFVTVEDHHIVGGLGSAVCEAAARLGLGKPVMSLGVREMGESGSPAELYERHGLSTPHIMDACIRNAESQ